MLDVVLDQFALGIGDRTLDRVKLLRLIHARALLFEHRDDGGEMSMHSP